MSIVSAVGQMMRRGAPVGPVLYGGGAFTAVRSETRNRAAVVSSDPLLPLSEIEVGAWNPDCDNQVETMVLSGDDMYLGGFFTLVGGQPRNGAACVASDPNSAATLRDWNPNCNNTVHTMILNGPNMYLGGRFTTVRGGTTRNRAACVDSNPTQENPTLRNWNPNCGNFVHTMLLNGPDMYLGGIFTLVGGQERNRAACVDSDPTQASPDLREWNPNCGNSVLTMILNGDDMYLGGAFTIVQDNTRNRAACVDSNSAATNPTVRPWNPNCSSTVTTMLLNEADMYLGGQFTTVQDTIRNRAACVASDPNSAATLRNWNPNCDNAVRAMILDGADMYLGGNFTTVGVEPRNHATCVDSNPDSAATLRDWHPHCSSTVRTMVLDGDDMYLGGQFTAVGGTSEHLRAFASPLLPDASELDLFPWNPNCDGTVWTMVLNGADMYLGGFFTLVGGQPRNGAACVDSNPAQANPALRAWNPNCGGSVRAMILDGADMYLGGHFTAVQDNTRNRTACVASDPTQPNPTLRNWHPNCDNAVRAMILDGADMYLGGLFILVGGETRRRAACVDSDPNSAEPTVHPWHPDCDNTVSTMVLSEADMYLGGLFTLVGGQPRSRAACVDRDTTQVSPTLRNWNPNCGGQVNTMLLSGDDMYLGGNFTTVGIGTRNRAACVASDPTAANPTLRAWHPDCGGGVEAMLLNGADMYLGGQFLSVSLADRLRAAAVDSDPATNFLLDYNLALNGTVNVLISPEGISSS